MLVFPQGIYSPGKVSVFINRMQSCEMAASHSCVRTSCAFGHPQEGISKETTCEHAPETRFPLRLAYDSSSLVVPSIPTLPGAASSSALEIDVATLACVYVRMQ